jgi:hypothetical protein
MHLLGSLQPIFEWATDLRAMRRIRPGRTQVDAEGTRELFLFFDLAKQTTHELVA